MSSQLDQVHWHPSMDSLGSGGRGEPQGSPGEATMLALEPEMSPGWH